MAFNIKICLVSNGCDLIDGQANIYLHNSVARSAGQMMMMAIAADTVVMGPIGKLYTV